MSISPRDDQSRSSKLKVFVHLAENKDAARWRESWLAGTLVGINDDTPYGYGRANRLGCHVTFSKAFPERPLAKLLRYGMRFVLGFDFLHAFRQRQALKQADVIWTHTESQYLAVAAVMQIAGIQTPLIGQTVWLFDHWDQLSWWKRSLYTLLIRRVNVLTFLSSANLKRAKALFPEAEARFVPFGIPAETKRSPRIRATEPFRILAVGSDRHRDWKTLIEVVKRRPDYRLTILSGTVPKKLVSGIKNVTVRLATSTRELQEEFEKASLVCVPLHENLHASGITVIQEAVLSGVPVLAADTGGLQDYFTENEILYFRAGDRAALLRALEDVREHPQHAWQLAVRAQARMGQSGLGAEDYIRQHVRISQAVLGRVADTGFGLVLKTRINKA